ncbi:transcriptional regulator, SarA/Rot family [Staphylococcus equorum]|uniref:transcriptional regulator, SarA/Rot family n=1 Tax=Staphylococcus equorum TaxID=246432 RepID=UPI0008062D42|nr:MarR family transcriptional regulator [Staphylococcus equorum]ANQ64947.1 spermidine/putrescine ABC transporter ATP-binding protein [Staphylococcus equorum]
MNEQNFKSLNELIATYQQGRKFFKATKKNYKLNYEEVLILNYLYNCKENDVTAKKIAQYSKLKPYYLTKALQKLIKMDFLNKKRSNIDERTVIVYINQAQRDKINELIENLQEQF